MNEYKLDIPSFFSNEAGKIYDTLFEYGVRTADRFLESYYRKLDQILHHPYSCAVDTVYPQLTQMQVRKAIIFNGRYLLLYLINATTIIPVLIERAERDYISQFEANLKLYKGE